MRKRVLAVVLFVAFALVIPTGCARGPLDGVPVLSIDSPPDVRRPQFDKRFRQAAVLGHAYSLPGPVSAFLDNGWVPMNENTRPVAAHDTGEVHLESGKMVLRLVLQNDGDKPIPWGQAQVVGINTYHGQYADPTFQVQPDTAKEDIIALLGAPDVDYVDEHGSHRNTISYYSLPVLSDRLLDAGTLWSTTIDDGEILDAGAAGLLLYFHDDEYDGAYGLHYYLSEPFDPESKMAVDVRCGNDRNRYIYSYQLQTDFFAASISDSQLAGYEIDGETYVFGVAYGPAAGWCHDMGSDMSFAQKVDAYLLKPSIFVSVGSSVPESRLFGPGEPLLLWDRDDSAAAALVHRGKGERTGDDYVQVWLNYCDWENGYHLSLFFSMISVEPGVAVSKGAEDYLLSMVSDVAKSMTKTR